MTRTNKLIALLLLLPFTLVACTKTDTTKDSSSTANTTATTIEEGGETTSDEPIDYVIEADNFKYSPSVIEAVAGETLRVKVTSDGTHDFVIDELGINSGIIDGEGIIEITVPLEATEQSYEFYCSVSNHRQMGMKGTLLVKNLGE